METKDLRAIASKNGYKYVETTDQLNGYPSHIQGGIIGFETQEEAEQFAQENGLGLIWIDKKAGWQLWHRGNTFYDAAELQPEDIGAVKFAYDEKEILSDARATMERCIEQDDELDAETFESILQELRKLNEWRFEAENMDDDFALPFFESSGEYGSPVQFRNVMSWDNNDGHYHNVAAVEDVIISMSNR